MADKILRCNSHHCELPFAVLRGRRLIIRSRHHGATHINEIDLVTLLEQAIQLNGTNFSILMLEKIEKSGIMIKKTYSA